MNEAAVWTKKKSQLNLGTDFTVTIYRDVSAWKTEQSDFDREYRVCGGIKASRQGVQSDTAHMSIYIDFTYFIVQEFYKIILNHILD